MAYSNSIMARGVCGNFRFKIYSITDAASTNSVINTDMCSVRFIGSSNKTDNADTFRARVLNWTSAADTNTLNEIQDTGETFVAQLTGSQAWNSTDNRTCTEVEFKDADELYTYKSDAAYDLCPDGNETYLILDDHKIMVTPVTANDDGYLLVFGK